MLGWDGSDKVFAIPSGIYRTIFVSACLYKLAHYVQRTCRECYYTYGFSRCVLSEYVGRATVLDVAAVAAERMNSRAVIGRRRMRSAIMCYYAPPVPSHFPCF